MNNLWRDVRYGLRMLAKNPAFTFVAVLTLALGIGAVTAIFSVVYTVLLRPLPYPAPDQLARVWQVGSRGGRMNFSDPNFEEVRDANRSFAAFAAFEAYPATVTGLQEALRVNQAVVSRQFLTAMGVQPTIGRAFSEDEMKFGGPPAALLSYSFWKNTLGGASDLSTLHLNIDGAPFSVVGVMPENFSYPEDSQIWAPREHFERYPSRTAHNWKVIGRMRPGVQVEQARADLEGIAKELKKKYGSDTDMSDTAALPLQAALTGNLRPALLMLLAAAAILLLAACSNTANLLLAKSASRQKEMAVRVALGAGRGRLAGQFLTESVLLSLIGGAAGILIAGAGLDVLLRFTPATLPALASVHLNWVVLSFTVALSLLTACGLALGVAFRSTRGDVVETLKQGQQSKLGGAGHARVRSLLMGLQVAMATMLLVGAGLLGKSLIHLLEVPTGYRTDKILTAEIYAPDMKNEADKARRRQELDQVMERVRAIPGVQSAGMVSSLPLGAKFFPDGTFLLVEDPKEMKSFKDFDAIAKIPERSGDAYYQAADDQYFRTMQIPLISGRLFDERDGPDTPHAAVISESLARAKWPSLDPIGHHIEFGNMDGDLRLLTIVGVVGDVRNQGLGLEPEQTIYVNARQRVPDVFSLVLHTEGDSAAVMSSVRSVLHGVDADFAPKFQMFRQIVSQSVGDREFQLYLLMIFAVTALGLAIIGLYGVTSYVVGERTPEIGVRMALGAAKTDVLRMILSQSAGTVLLGILVGAGGIAALTKVLQGFLYGVTPNDPIVFAGVGALLMLVAMAACYFPARRAMRIDPIKALRYE
ncbi:MAG TPA: ABC transporter permease [Candidatus Acidoferrum sp.]|jgi:predicted permease